MLTAPLLRAPSRMIRSLAAQATCDGGVTARLDSLVRMATAGFTHKPAITTTAARTCTRTTETSPDAQVGSLAIRLGVPTLTRVSLRTRCARSATDGSGINESGYHSTQVARLPAPLSRAVALPVKSEFATASTTVILRVQRYCNCHQLRHQRNCH